MWNLDTPWFDVAVVMSIFACGNILFGHFEQHRPKWKRLLKVIIVLMLVLGVTSTAGRAWGYGVLVVPLIAVIYVHEVWLPRHGINGWTAEPYDKYLELMRSRGHV
jgi:hypothetical protein